MTEYIRREDALEILHKVRYECVYNRQNVMYDGKVDTYKALVARFKAMPAADVVERKIGKWLGRSENDCYPVCSECCHTRIGSSLGYCQKYVPFCEHCGADMRGDDDV